MMEQITTEKREILLAIQGTNVWSGQTLQRDNSAVSISKTRIELETDISRLSRGEVLLNIYMA
jgi:hypothetical protein